MDGAQGVGDAGPHDCEVTVAEVHGSLGAGLKRGDAQQNLATYRANRGSRLSPESEESIRVQDNRHRAGR